MPQGFAAFLAQVQARWPFLPADVAARMAHAYGTRMQQIVGKAQSWADLGEDVGGGLTEAEVAYLRTHEWAYTAEDILWRRTKLGLTVTPETTANLARWLAAQ